MKEMIKENTDICDEIVKKFDILLKSKATGPDIYFLIEELKTKTEWLKTLYIQKIT